MAAATTPAATAQGFGRSSHALVRMRSASPLGSSYCRARSAQTKASSPSAPSPSETGISTTRISIPSPFYRSRSAFSVTLTELSDMASAAISGVARPAMAKGTAMTL